jgi:beta-galactosidase
MTKIHLYLSVAIVFLVSCSTKSETPEVINFNKNWQFTRINENTANRAEVKNQGSGWSSQYDVTHTTSDAQLAVSKQTLTKEFNQLNESEWEDVSIPHNPVVEDLTVKHQWQGICYYKKRFVVEDSRKESLCFLEFEGAMQLADVWINGKHLIQHAGGYTPFIIDIAGFLKYGEENEILVRLDNRNNPLIPPGKPVEKLDFCYHGGIYRDVNLIFKNKIHITNPVFVDEVAGGGVFVTYPEVSPQKAVVEIKTHVANEQNMSAEITVRHTLFKINGLYAQRDTGTQVAINEASLSIAENTALGRIGVVPRISCTASGL